MFFVLQFCNSKGEARKDLLQVVVSCEDVDIVGVAASVGRLEIAKNAPLEEMSFQTIDFEHKVDGEDVAFEGAVQIFINGVKVSPRRWKNLLENEKFMPGELRFEVEGYSATIKTE